MPETLTFPRTRQGVRNLDAVKEKVLPVSGGPAPQPSKGLNVGSMERLLCVFGGAALALYGLSRRKRAGLGLAMTGGTLLYRGLTGHCHLYDMFGLSTAGRSNPLEEIIFRRR
jgi:uncharacterized membrane protein